ncbi:NADPH:quinone reductase-like Zn-dependent oxidoreductase [Nocardia tenerifensis]|uniref:NADPH:quinone reductase-like Zn-dependent oxidoreductase n=1 Tax=Nocardia tenerifensis TaxID=228006 RepID=A0A318K2N4_9NOCA|nr:NADP-dependent oxidoreductase [Nocardia tenerifensis]PXX61744.1 NADPH:quinone reductase-like Zn-dependent oxidoreductase [Nocardia tenerifensis]
MLAVLQEEWGSPEKLRVTEIDRPAPSYGELLVEVAAAGVNPVDYYTALGKAYNRVLELPFVQGWDVAGVVTEVGYGATRFQPGDRVFGMPWFPRAAGAYAEYVTAPARHFAKMPERASFSEAAALPLAGLTAWQMLVDVAEVRSGQRVLITAAAGGVGHLAVQIAKSFGAYVIGTASAAKHAFVRDLGADEVVDYTAVDIADAVGDIDVAIQMFGGTAALDALRCLRPGAIMVNAQSAWTPGMTSRATELGVRASGFLVEPDHAGLADLARLVDAGQLRVHIDSELPLARAAEAHQLIGRGRTTGKVVLTVGDPARFDATGRPTHAGSADAPPRAK